MFKYYLYYWLFYQVQYIEILQNNQDHKTYERFVVVFI